MEKPPLDIAFVSDVGCPWCAIGLASFEQALARLGNEVAVKLHFEPFELNPDMPPEGAETVAYLMRKYSRTAEQVGEAQARIREAGLCASCRHARVQRNARGGRFWRCARADEDARFRRYPPQPVERCPGHEADEVG